jgi:hypothetical protein
MILISVSQSTDPATPQHGQSLPNTLIGESDFVTFRCRSLISPRTWFCTENASINGLSKGSMTDGQSAKVVDGHVHALLLAF